MEQQNAFNEGESNKSEELTLKDRYQLVITARNFHYDNFNKWTTYFYVAMGAIFVGYCSVMTSDNTPFNTSNEGAIIKIGLLFLGFITSYLWYVSAKGYYHWAVQFINLINHYEVNLLRLPKHERVYCVHSNKKLSNNIFSPIGGANISTSKVAILFSLSITVCWAWLFFFTLIKELSVGCNSQVSECGRAFLAIVFTPVSILIFNLFSKVFLESYIDHMPDLKFNINDEI